MKSCFGFITAFLFSAVVFASPSPGFHINGTVTGLPDSTWLYLQNSKPYTYIDSCRVINGRFSMKGRLKEKAATVVLHTAQFRNYVFFWLENTRITCSLQAGAFKKGTIEGSAAQDESKAFALLSEPFSRRIDSLKDALSVTKDTGERKGIRLHIKNLEQEIISVEQRWIRTHPHSIIAADALNIYAAGWGRETTKALYAHFSPGIKKTRPGREIGDFIALNQDIRLGGPYVDFEQPDTTGTMVRLSSIRARYILLDFWASWCGPCREENSNLVKTYTRFREKGFAVFGVSLDDDRKNWMAAIRKDQLAWENVTDLRGDKNRAALMYGIHAVPSNFLIDDKGMIIARDLRGQALNDKLEALLQ